jgi:hypothetical protein
MFLLETVKGRGDKEDLCASEWKILEWLLQKYDGRRESDSRERPVLGSCEHSKRPTSSTKGGEFLDHLFTLKNYFKLYNFKSQILSYRKKFTMN